MQWAITLVLSDGHFNLSKGVLGGMYELTEINSKSHNTSVLNALSSMRTPSPFPNLK